MVKYLTQEEILTIHYMVMELYDEIGQAGILFKDRFHAVHRPWVTVFDQEAYTTIELKAAALLQSLVQEHPFKNGNKRTAFACVIIFLDINNYMLKMSSQEAEDFMVAVATLEEFKGKDGYIEIAKVLEIHTYKYI